MEDGSLTLFSDSVGPNISQYVSMMQADKPAATSTGSVQLDKLLSGGIQSSCIYEMSGFKNSGKLVVALTVVNNVLKKDKKVLWIDTSSQIPLQSLIKLSEFKSTFLQSDNLKHIRVPRLAQLIVLLKQLNTGVISEQFSLIVVNDFGDLVHSSFVSLEVEQNKRRLRIAQLQEKMELERKLRETVGETYHFPENLPLQGSSILVRQNKLMHYILQAFTSYNTHNQASTIFLGSLNVTPQKLIVDVAKKEFSREMKVAYQSRLVPMLGEECSWTGLLECRMLFYKDWKHKINVRDAKSVKFATTLTCVNLKFNRPLITKDPSLCNHRMIRSCKKLQLLIASEGVEDLHPTTSDTTSTFEFSSTPIQFTLNSTNSSPPKQATDTSFDTSTLRTHGSLEETDHEADMSASSTTSLTNKRPRLNER